MRFSYRKGRWRRIHWGHRGCVLLCTAEQLSEILYKSSMVTLWDRGIIIQINLSLIEYLLCIKDFSESFAFINSFWQLYEVGNLISSFSGETKRQSSMSPNGNARWEPRLLLCSICQCLCYKYSLYSWSQATNMMSSTTGFKRDMHSWLFWPRRRR